MQQKHATQHMHVHACAHAAAQWCLQVPAQCGMSCMSVHAAAVARLLVHDVRACCTVPAANAGGGGAAAAALTPPASDSRPVAQPRDWSASMNKKEKKLALSTALQSAAADMIVCDDFSAMQEVRALQLRCAAQPMRCAADALLWLCACCLAVLLCPPAVCCVRVPLHMPISPSIPRLLPAGEDQGAGVCAGVHGRAGGREGASEGRERAGGQLREQQCIWMQQH